ncbi:hypothetical protein KKB84_00540 [bacterium]|nr:hypothetical protein [bacterium]MBU1152455.1 hypothetical protein [bacterium]
MNLDKIKPFLVMGIFEKAYEIQKVSKKVIYLVFLPLCFCYFIVLLEKGDKVILSDPAYPLKS